MPIRDLFKNKDCFVTVPADWCIVIVDVEIDPSVFNKELNNDANIAATGSIITILNLIKSLDTQLQIPYFFRGSGATFIVPQSILVAIMSAMDTYKKHVFKTLNLSLQFGSVTVADVFKITKAFSIAKLRLNDYLVIPVILGNGLKVAEQLVRKKFKGSVDQSISDLPLDLQGMECRWDEIDPLIDEKKIICLLVNCEIDQSQADIFIKIFDEIDYQFGDLKKRTPITTEKLKLDNSFKKMRKEMYARLGKFNRRYLLQNWLITYLGSFYFKFFKNGKNYLYRVTQLSDTMVLDGSINTVFAGTERNINKLKLFLDALEADGKIYYGLHATHASIMSCYIEDRDENHIHFVDGTEGGYRMADLKLKTKIGNRFAI